MLHSFRKITVQLVLAEYNVRKFFPWFLRIKTKPKFVPGHEKNIDSLWHSYNSFINFRVHLGVSHVLYDPREKQETTLVKSLSKILKCGHSNGSF